MGALEFLALSVLISFTVVFLLCLYFNRLPENARLHTKSEDCWMFVVLSLIPILGYAIILFMSVFALVVFCSKSKIFK
jgi:hypothetical protein